MTSGHLGFISAAVLFTGCVYTIDTALSDPEPTDSALAGRWIAQDGDVADVAVSDTRLYRIHLHSTFPLDTAPTRSDALHAQLGMVGSSAVLELWPALSDGDNDDRPVDRIVAAIELHGDSIITFALNRDSVHAAVTRATHISHLMRGDDVILTGNTAELSMLLLDLLARPGFTERSVWRRQK